MSNVQALAEALVYLDGLDVAGPTDAEDQARILIQQLAERGYVVRAPLGSVLLDRSPANLLATCRMLGLRAEDVARIAGVDVATVQKAESPERRPHVPSIEAVAAALNYRRRERN